MASTSIGGSGGSNGPSGPGDGNGNGNGELKMLAADSPSYISSKSANSLISFSRPTRIQAVTLFYLNKILDEVLLQILASAKSLATDRIKSDGIVRVLGGASGSGSGAGALLAKNAVLEAEMELRSYTEGLRKEGGKVPLGLSATSRLDGTDNFPVKSAYDLLRVRCQYYSTLGDLEDPSPNSPPDQNIMSRDGRPIATITPGVAIYVTALLEFVADYILQNVGRVIERDNSDEASLSDLRKAVEEDEATSYVWARLETRQDILLKETEEKQRGGGGRVGRPWKVPDESELDEAAGRRHFSRHSLTPSSSAHMASVLRSSQLQNGSNTTATTSSSGYADSSKPSLRRPTSSNGGASAFGHDSTREGSNMTSPSSPTVPTSASGHTNMTSMSSSSDGNTNRRPSADKPWGGILAGRRRGSFRKSQDMNGSGGLAPPQRPVLQTGVTSPVDDVFAPDDDFDALVMSGETMKVSLTPNRLRSMEGQTDDDVDAKKNARRRPGAPMTVAGLRESEEGSSSPAQLAPSAPRASGSADSFPERNSLSGPPPPTRSLSRNGSINMRPSSSQKNVNKVSGAPPPSSYRGPDTPPVKSPTRSRAGSGENPPAPPSKGGEEYEGREEEEEEEVDDYATGDERGKEDAPTMLRMGSGSGQKMRARDAGRSSQSVREMVEMFNATPPSPINAGHFPTNGRESSMSQRSNSSIENGRRSALSTAGGKVRNLFGVGRKGSSSNSAASKVPRPASRNTQQPQSRAANASWSSTRNSDAAGEGVLSDDNMSSSIDHAPSTAHSSVNERSSMGGVVAGGAAAAAAAASVVANNSSARNSIRRTDSERRSGGKRSLQEHGEVEERALDAPIENVSARSSYEAARAVQSSENLLTADKEFRRSSVSSTSPQHRVKDGHGGLFGNYDEARDASDTKRPSSSGGNSRTDPPSRKIAWSYARPGVTKRMSGPPAAIRQHSGSGSVSHGSDSNAPPSAWTTTSASLPGHGGGLGNDSTDNLSLRTPTPVQTFFPAISPRPTTPADTERRAIKSDTARVLVQLDRRLKGATTVEECRRMVQHALALAAAAVHDEDRPDGTPVFGTQSSGSAPFGEIPDEDEQSADKLPRHQTMSRPPSTKGSIGDIGAAAAAAATAARRTTEPHAPKPVTRFEKMVSTSDAEDAKLPAAFRGHTVVLPMAQGYDAALDQTTPLYRHHGLVAAWLLDGGAWEESEQAPAAPAVVARRVESIDDVAATSPRLSLEEYESADERGDSPRVMHDEAFESSSFPTNNGAAVLSPSSTSNAQAKSSPLRSTKQLPGSFSAAVGRGASAMGLNNGHAGIRERKLSAVESVKSSALYKDAMEEATVE